MGKQLKNDPLGLRAQLNGSQTAVEEPVNSIPTSTQDDPLGLRAELKKKDNTIVGQSGEESTSPASSTDSSKPSEQGTKQQEKNGTNWVQGNFDDWQKKKIVSYTSQLKNEVDEFNKRLGLTEKPDLTNKDAVNAYNQKINIANEFQKKRAQQLDSKFQEESKAESEKINSTLQKFNDLNAKRKAKSTNVNEDPRNEDEGIPFAGLFKSIGATLTDQLPGGIAAGIAGSIGTNFAEKILTKQNSPLVDEVVKNYHKQQENNPSHTTTKEELDKFHTDVENAYLKQVGTKKFSEERSQYVEQKAKLKDDLLKYSDQQQAEQQEKLKAMPSSWKDANGYLGVEQYLEKNIGQIAGLAVPTVAASAINPTLGAAVGFGTMGTLEKGEAYKEGITLLETNTGLDRKELFKKDADSLLRDATTKSGIVNGLLEYVGQVSVVGKFMPKNYVTQLISKFAKNKGTEATVGSFVEGLTEWLQAKDTHYAAAIGSGQTPEQAAKSSFAQDDSEEFIAGLTGGGGLSIAGMALSKPTPQVIKEQKANISSTEDQANITKAANTIVDNLKNEESQKSTTAVTGKPESVGISTEPTAVPETAKETPLPLQVNQENKTQTITSQEEIPNDTANQQRIPGQERIGQEPIQTGIEQGGSRTQAETGGVLQTPSEEQKVEEPDHVVGNYVKRQGSWFRVNKDGVEEKVLDLNKPVSESKGSENIEIQELKSIQNKIAHENRPKAMHQQERDRIKGLDRTTLASRVRGFFLDGGKIRWNEVKDESGKKLKRGSREELGYSEGDRRSLMSIQDEKNSLSPEQIAHKLASQYDERYTDTDYKDAILDILSTDRSTWFNDQREELDPDHGIAKQNREYELNEISNRIQELENQEQGIQTETKNLYENERRVYPASETEGSGVRGETSQQASTAKPDAAASIRENGDENKSKQALKDISGLNLTHVQGLGMGQNQAKGTYLSTEQENRYQTEENKPLQAKVKINKPFVSENGEFYNIQRQAIQERFGKNSVDDLTEAEADLLAEMMSEYFVNEGYDSIYFPESPSQEGELIVFDKNKVTLSEPISKPTVAGTISEATKLYDEIENTKGSAKKRSLASQRRALLDAYPSVKFIDDNISNIYKQLEQKNIITKKGNCP